MESYDILPETAKKRPTKFSVSISEDRIQRMRQLIELSQLGPRTYENTSNECSFGLSYEWLRIAKAEWVSKFDWRAQEKHINSFHQYMLDITDDDGRIYPIHFVALFSTNPSAVPIAFFHGWPGSFLEFLPLLSILRQKYPSAEQLPYHIVVPSLPGYAFSAQLPEDRNWTCADSSRLMHKLLIDLGFGESGYIAQGGDVGSFVSQLLARTYPECKAIHLNFCFMLEKPDSVPGDAIDEVEAKQLARKKNFTSTGSAYALEHATRPATVGFVLSTSPLALLAWIGEKFLAWTDSYPTLDTILTHVSLYWLTDSFPTSIYPYREHFLPKTQPQPAAYIDRPMGFSWFPLDTMPTPKAWIATTGNLVWFRQHTEGGHFPALEKPGLLLADVEEFVRVVLKA